jgi:hypothetical protein
MIAKLRKAADIKKFSADLLGDTKMGDMVPPNVLNALSKSEKGMEALDRSLGVEQLDDAALLEGVALLIEIDGKATPEQLAHLEKLAEEKDRFAETSQDELDEYNEWQEFHLDDEEEPDEPDDDEDAIQEYRDEAEFYRSVVKRLQ